MEGRPGAAPLVLTALLAISLASLASSELDKRELALLDKADRSGIAPDLIETIPRAIFEARFQAGPIEMGNAFTPNQASAMPTSLYFPRAVGYKYTIAMLDPDAPSYRDPKFRPILHWLVVNVEAGDIKAPVNLKKGSVLFKYRGPKPPLGSGQHRYVFLAYRQYRDIDVTPSLVVPFEKRKNFNMAKFATDQSLGKPIAVNYFLSEDCSVDGVTPVVVWIMVVLLALTVVVGRFALLQ